MSINAQDVVGTYQLKVDANNGNLLRTLTLNADGTFEYYNYRFVEKGIPKETHLHAKGTWEIDNKILVFSSEVSDFDDTYTLNFNGTKARFISKSPRDKSDRNIETLIRFYESEIFWIKGMTLIKII